MSGVLETPYLMSSSFTQCSGEAIVLGPCELPLRVGGSTSGSNGGSLGFGWCGLRSPGTPGKALGGGLFVISPNKAPLLAGAPALVLPCAPRGDDELDADPACALRVYYNGIE